MAATAHAVQMSDTFAARPVVKGATASFTGDSAAATLGLEIGEPNHGGARHRTVWAAWTAPGNGTVTISTLGSNFDTVLAVYVGNALAELQPVAQEDDIPNSKLSSVHFPTKANVTYAIAVDGSPNSNTTGQGLVQVNVAFAADNLPGSEVGTDAFALRPTLAAGLDARGTCNNRTFTLESFEPPRFTARHHTAWWRWVAPVNGLVTIDTLASDFDTGLTIYAGDSFADLTEVAVSGNAPNVIQSVVSFQARAGGEYQIMVDGQPNSNTGGEGNIQLKVHLVPNFEPGGVPGSDAFADRGRLTGLNALGVACNILFGLEAFEPNHGSARHQTAWWQWTAPADGMVRIHTDGSNFDTFVAVYTGSTLPQLQRIASNNNAPNAVWSEVFLSARRGENYQIVVDGSPNSNATGEGNIVVRVDQAVPLPQTLAIYPAVELELPGQNGVSYQAQGSPDLIQWENIGNPQLGTGAPIRLLNPARGSNHRYFRYRTLP